jgi:hypothetical protein
MRPTIRALMLTISLAGFACRDEPPATAATSSTPSPIDEPVIDAVGAEAPIVRVLDAGREPRVALEQPPIAGERNVQLEMEMSPLGYPSGAPMTMRMTLKWSASATDAVPWRFALERAELKLADAGSAEQKAVDALAAMYAQAAGHARRRGPAHLEIVQTKGMTSQPSVPWMLHLFAFAPPSEALGPGAKWTTDSQVDVDGQRCSASLRYEIIDIGAQELTARLAATQRCAPVPGTTESEPTMTTTMTGELRFVPTDALAIAGEITCTLATSFPVSADDADAPKELDATMRLRLSTSD